MTNNIINYVDCSLHASAFPSTYVIPGPIANLLQQPASSPIAAGTTSGSLNANSPQYVSGDTNTWAMLVGNCVSGPDSDVVAGYFTTPATEPTQIVIPVGFAPTHVHVIDWTTYAEYEWFLGAPATDGIKRAAASTYNSIVTDSPIIVTADAAGGSGDTNYVTILGSLFTAADVVSFRIEQ